MTDVALIERPQRREIAAVIDPIPTLDTARFEHMQRIATVMARSTMIPETLRTIGTRDNKIDLPPEQVMANCFLVVNQAVRWGMDPFAVVSCCAVVHGRLSYEGKLVAAVLDSKIGVELRYHFTGDASSEIFRVYVLDQDFSPEIIGQLKPGISIPGLRLWDGSVAEWKTTGAGTPWTQKNYKRMLIYRGSRDWTRIYEPAIMLGVYTEDELIELADDARARRSAPVVSLAERLAIGRPTQDNQNGFSEAHVAQELRPKEPETDQSSAPADAGADHVQASAPPHSSSGSIAAPQLSPEPDTKPASEGVEAKTISDGAGISQSSAAPSVEQKASAAEDRQATESGASALHGSGGLPEGWERDYAKALGRATKPHSLSKYATAWWAPHGGWVAHKSGPNAGTATAIYDSFANYFGEAGKEARETILHELGAA